jgi:hypothetical protein
MHYKNRKMVDFWAPARSALADRAPGYPQQSSPPLADPGCLLLSLAQPPDNEHPAIYRIQPLEIELDLVQIWCFWRFGGNIF